MTGPRDIGIGDVQVPPLHYDPPEHSRIKKLLASAFVPAVQPEIVARLVAVFPFQYIGSSAPLLQKKTPLKSPPVQRSSLAPLGGVPVMSVRVDPSSTNAVAVPSWTRKRVVAVLNVPIQYGVAVGVV